MTDTVVEKKPIVMSTSKADEFFKNFPKDKVVAYKDYWETSEPCRTRTSERGGRGWSPANRRGPPLRDEDARRAR